MQKENDNNILINKLIINNKLSHAFLIEVDDKYTTTFSKNIVKEILKNKVKQEEYYKICNLIDCDNFPELKIIKPDGKFIKKEQLVQLMNELKNKPVYSDNSFYIVEFAENLNVSSANTILKFLEEPEDGIIAILITKNIYEVLSTISSRCQILNFNNFEKKIFDSNFEKYAVDFIIGLKTSKKYSVAYFSEVYALKSDELVEIFNICIIIYSEILTYLKNKIKGEFLTNNFKFNNILDTFEVSEIIDIVNKLSEGLNLLKYNVNPRVVLDKLIIYKEDVVL